MISTKACIDMATYFTRMLSDTGINMVIINEDERPDGSMEVLINYINDFDEEKDSGIVADNIFVGDISEQSDLLKVLGDLMQAYEFEWLDVWFDKEGPPNRICLGSYEWHPT